MDKGSRNATNAALYYFTASGAFDREGSTIVDIVLHYPSADTVWVEDAIPTGGVAGGNESWDWLSAPPFSGAKSHTSITTNAFHQHYFSDATGSGRLAVRTGDTLFTYALLNTTSLPSEIMLEFQELNTGWDHRVYWGSNTISGGTAPYYYAGPLPAKGQWVRLSVPASALGLENGTLVGMSFTLYGGKVTFDRAGTSAFAGTDQDLDGIPDYLEDLNGNNVRDGAETLVNNADSDGDGLSDGLEVSLGIDPNVDRKAQTGSRHNIGYDRVNRLNNVSGSASLSLGLDKEGNIQPVSP